MPRESSDCCHLGLLTPIPSPRMIGTNKYTEAGFGEMEVVVSKTKEIKYIRRGVDKKYSGAFTPLVIFLPSRTAIVLKDTDDKLISSNICGAVRNDVFSQSFSKIEYFLSTFSFLLPFFPIFCFSDEVASQQFLPANFFVFFFCTN